VDDDLDDGPVTFDANATTASLGHLCGGPPITANDGEWWLLLEDGQQRPLQFVHIALSFDSPQAPIVLTEEALTRAGYEHTRLVTAEPWATQWQLITGADRMPRTNTP